MALYKTHAKLNILIALPIVLGICTYLLKTDPKLLLIFSSAFIYGTLYMNPDLDLAHSIKLFSFRGVLTMPFRGYSKIFKHRGISHSIILGTLTRVGYLVGLAFFISYFLLQIPYFHQEAYLFYQSNKTLFITGFLGLFLADFFHILVDVLTPKRK